MEHVNGWCFRGIYKGGLWENDLHVSAPSPGFVIDSYSLTASRDVNFTVVDGCTA